MDNEAVIMVRVAFTAVFVAVVLAGIYLFRNNQRFFGVDRTVTSEGSSSRAYSKMFVWAIWWHALILSAAFALFLH